VVPDKQGEDHLERSCEKQKELYRIKDVRNIIQTIKRKKENWIGHMVGRNRLLKHGTERKIEGRIEVTGRRGIRCNQLLNDLKEKKRYRK
jgi:hypothetical protein